MTRPKAQFVDPRDAGLRGLSLSRPVFDDGAVVRATQALETMGESMEAWLDADISKLQTARVGAERANWGAAELGALLVCAHDLKGMGTTYGFPLVSKLASSLCQLLDTEAGKAAAKQHPSLVCAHVDALRAAVRDRIRDEHHRRATRCSAC